ncbi:hypothetical protein BDZ45DRAFT_743047 [Acephala macrosclerotiorum]|nr:hypothetical protein BDZ45DRAFT_743047 [Acephala macrosclerotiorum]
MSSSSTRESRVPECESANQTNQQETINNSVVALANHDDAEPIFARNPINITSQSHECYWDIILFEIREQIFANLNEQSNYGWIPTSPFSCWEADTPAIVKALRHFPVAYGHALQWFARASFPFISDKALPLSATPHGLSPYGTSHCLMDLDISKAELAVIERTTTYINAIVCNSYIQCGEDRNDKEIVYEFKKPTSITEQFIKMPNVREVVLYLDLDSTNQGDMSTFLTEFPFWLQGFNALSKVTVEIPTWPTRQREHSMVHGIVEGIYKKTGVQGQLVEISEIRNNKVHKAELGKEYKSRRQYRCEARDLKDFYEYLHTRLEFDEGISSFSLDGWHYCWLHVGESYLVEDQVEDLHRQGYDGW